MKIGGALGLFLVIFLFVLTTTLTSPSSSTSTLSPPGSSGTPAAVSDCS
jgi:hypothetical protein